MFKNKQKRILWWILIFVIIFFTHADHPLNADEGVILEGAWNLYNNRHLYFDFFEFIPPGSFYLILAVWKILGVSYWAAKAISILVMFGSAVGIYLSAQIIKPSKSNIAAPLLFALVSSFIILINHNIYNLFFIIYAIYFILLAIDQQKLKYYGFSGLFSGVAILFLQQKGLVLSGIIGLFILIDTFKNYKNWLIYTLGLILPLLILLVWPLKTIYYNLIVFPLSTYIEVNKISFLLLIIVLFIFILTVYFFRKSKNKKVWLLLIIQFFLILTTIPLPDSYHLVIAVAPIFSLTGLIIDKIGTNRYFYQKIIHYYILIAIFAGFMIFPLHYLMNGYSVFSFDEKDKIQDIISKCPGKYIYVGPFAPNVYFEFRKLNATPYPLLMTSQSTPAQFENALEYLKNIKPLCAILNYPSSLNRFKYNKDNLVDNYIKDKYYLVYSDNTTFVYRLK